ncbi:MAG: hypothetical protein E6I32_18360, partial [Chloroflexi bacterium]
MYGRPSRSPWQASRQASRWSPWQASRQASRWSPWQASRQAFRRAFREASWQAILMVSLQQKTPSGAVLTFIFVCQHVVSYIFLSRAESYMQHTFLRKLGIVCATIALIGVSIVSVALIARARQNQPYALTTQIPPLVSRAHLVGPADAQQQLNLSVGLQLRNKQELANLLSELSNPRSPMYHQYLTPQEFVAQFGPTADQVQQVKNYLQQQGLTITSVSPNGLLIDARATVAQAESAFAVTINN